MFIPYDSFRKKSRFHLRRSFKMSGVLFLILCSLELDKLTCKNYVCLFHGGIPKETLNIT